jgi:hypothetical protein
MTQWKEKNSLTEMFQKIEFDTASGLCVLSSVSSASSAVQIRLSICSLLICYDIVAVL